LLKLGRGKSGKMRFLNPEDLDQLGIPRERLVISSGFASKSEKPPSAETEHPPTGRPKRARRERRASDEAKQMRDLPGALPRHIRERILREAANMTPEENERLSAEFRKLTAGFAKLYANRPMS
jgi:hypothetical protein